MNRAGPDAVTNRGSWASRAGFVLAAAGSAVGLGNIWRFPYVTGKNGGGLFVLVYIGCVTLVALPVMVAEILIGRATQRSPIAAFRRLVGRRGSGWTSAGWLGVLAGFMIMSFYSVVAGWAVYYAVIALFKGFADASSDQIHAMFANLVGSYSLNLLLHTSFMLLTIYVVIRGVQAGIERWSRLLMPLLFAMLLGMLIYGLTLPGRTAALRFMFGVHRGELKAAGLLEALGQAFFSLSLGMGALTTYGSYLPRRTSILRSALWVVSLDTVVALMAGLVIFPVTFTHGIAPADGPGLVFHSLPVAFSVMTGGRLLAIVFFSLLVFAALTSAISLLEVVVASLIDVRGWSRRSATLVAGGGSFVLGIPSALSASPWFGAGMKGLVGMDFLELMDTVSGNWMLPLGGLMIAAYVGWALDPTLRDEEFIRETPRQFRLPWLWMLRILAPAAVLLIMLQKTGLLGVLGF